MTTPHRQAAPMVGILGSGLLVLVSFSCASEPSGDPVTANNDTAALTDVSATADTTSLPQDAGQGAATPDAGTGHNDATLSVDVPAPVDAGTPAAPTSQDKAAVPFGETLFFSGDDYLWAWGKDAKSVTVTSKPTGATATVQGAAPGRLTPDKPGVWKLCRGTGACVDVTVTEDSLNADTFLNYNYSPSNPIAARPVAKGTGPATKQTLWVTATTSNAVHKVEISGDGAKSLKLISVGSWPTAIVWSETAKAFLVTHCGRDSLGFLDPDTDRMVDAIHVGNEPANVVVDGDWAYVALSGENRIAKIDLKNRVVTAVIEVGRDPRAMAFDSKAKRLYAASLLSSNKTPRGLLQDKTKPLPESMLRDVAVIDTEAFKVLGFAKEVGTILRGLYLRPDQPGKLLVALTKANNDQAKIDADSKPHQHMIAVVDTAKAAISGAAVDEVVDLDALLNFTGPAASPYTMQLSPDTNYLVVTLSASRTIMFLDAKDNAELGRIEVGHDPRGLHFFAGRIWTYAWLSNALQGVELPGAPVMTTPDPGGGKNPKKIKTIPAPTQKTLTLKIGNDPTPLEVKAGQRLFNDAAFSKHKDFSCNNCHVDGITDGLVWDLLVDGSVNTIAFRNVGGTGPFLWGGQLPTLFDFSREVLKLVGAQASGKQMEDLTTYMQSVTAPPNPYTLPGGRFTKAAKSGQKLFYGSSAAGGAGCGDCHGGPLYTNTDVVDGKTKGKKTDVPSLLGTYDTGPWGREAQWTTLKEMTEFAAAFTKATLTDKQKGDLLAFVQELPGNRLYVTSAKPLDNSHYVWAETAIEVSFSALLAPGQEGLLLFREVPANGAPKAVPGDWTTSGRYARFKPKTKLKQETPYHISVGSGLVGQLGEQLSGGITIKFATGSPPEVDVSGKWQAVLQQALIGKQTAQLAFLQAKGGQVTGALLSKFEQGDIEKGSVEGHVSGKVLVLDPFYLDTSFGKFFLEQGITSTCKDPNGDKFADSCVGSFPFKFGGTTYTVNVTFKRLALPAK